MNSSNRVRSPFFASGVVAALLSVVLLAPSATADPKFPTKLAADWNMPCVPSCAVCHLDASGGPARIRKTVNGKTGFGGNLESRYGLDVSDLSSLEPALAGAKKDGSDVDGDGKSDYDELSHGEDPNDPNNTQSVCDGPEFGCARVARPGPIDGIASVSGALVLVFGAGALRRRAKR